MFTPAEREGIRAALVAEASRDPAVAGAALVGSAAHDAEDEWSDIDLALQLAAGADEAAVVRDWTAVLGGISPVADTFDLFSGGVRYRVTLLESSLQVDLSFWPFDRFRSTGEPFRLLFGTPQEPAEPRRPDLGRTVGTGWLLALHARSAIARGRLWQATMMLDQLRDEIVTMMCVRSGLPSWHGRGVDGLSSEDRAGLERSRAVRVSRAELDASRCGLVRLLSDEIGRQDAARAARLAPALEELSTPLADMPAPADTPAPARRRTR
ncbi:nucleotidyltransferase domain-containing protein [Leifsonia shinshuensis]|uniref:nucleotidyltransferase domain-containing protein n=1 Tax=Leifsonia shinshuensis TaxID=150026 RepID=UPI001F510E20|nr:nucleotidyltransferase domain-containing protein [Leifsonia shinshuensis]MCI0158960.1 nucleotidyltransferase domain-containing protein [Leifsonia shinshuensis]